MTPEDRLRDLLRQEARSVVPAGDGLTKIQQRLARRRRMRLFLLPSAALATAGATAAFFLLGPGTRPTTLTVEPGDDPSSSATPVPGPTASTAPTQGTYDGPAVWPFTSAAQAQAWTPGGSYPWAESKKDVIKNLLVEHLALTTLQAGFELKETTAAPTCTGCEVLELVTVDNRKAASVTVAGFATTGGKRVFTVVGVHGGDLTVTRPSAGAAIASPTAVSGHIAGVDENVRLQVVTSSGVKIAETGSPAGSEAPWQASLEWTDTSWTNAALVGSTGSAKDGALNRLVVVPVTRATGASAGPSFVGLVEGHVSQFDATSGELLKQLTFPPAGKLDVAATWAAGTVAWVRSQQTGCVDELNRLDNGVASTVVRAGTVHLGTPQLSPSAGWLAWVQTPCSGSAASIIVSGGGAPDRTLAVPNGMQAVVLDVRDDGALLLHLNDLAATDAGTIGVVPPGALSLAGMKPLAATGDCYLAGGAAFDVDAPVAFETCRADSRLVRFTDQGTRTSVDAAVTGMAAPRSITTRAGKELVWLKGGAVASYADGRLTTLIDSGVHSPDW